MDSVLYIDVLFLTDFWGNFLALFLAAALLRRSFPPFRAAAGAAFGSLWGCFFAVFPILPKAAELILTLAGAGSLMAAFTFSLKDLKSILKALGMLAVSGVLMGGGTLLLKQYVWLEDWEILVCLTAVSWAGRVLAAMRTAETARGKARYRVLLYYKGEAKEFLALCDSGNRLREPVSRKPVSVISYKDCRGFCDTVGAVRYIPYRAVGTESGLLPGLVFEKMEIFTGEQCRKVQAPVVAIVKAPLSADGDFSMLLPEEFVL